MKRMFAAAILLALCGCAAAGPTVSPRTSADRLPPLLDRELFFGDPEISGAQISPNGEFVSFSKPYRNVRNIWVKRTQEPFEAARPVTADTTRPVPGYFWSRDSRYVLYVQDKGGNENYHIYAVDPSAAPEAQTGVPPARDLTPYGAVQAQIYAVPRGTPNSIVVGLNDRDAQVHDVYRVDLRSGDRELLLENTENVVGWVTDLDGAVRLGARVGQDGGTEILRVDGDKLTEVYRCSNEETCGPVRFHKDRRWLYMITNKGADVDLARLILFDPQTLQEEFVESDPEGQVDFGGAAFSEVTNELLATVYVGDRVRIYPKTRAFARDLDRLRQQLPEGELSLGSATADERRVVVRVARDVDPGSAYLYDRETGEVELLYRSRPELPSQQLASMRAVRYPARDGFEIPAYLTVPRGVPSRNLPTVIVPHGGPWARDRWGYDPYAQYLANRGYAVLQPNFRGSTGYGKRFLNAGNGEWGTGAMQHDITDGVRYLIEQGIADSTRVGIFGGSYGGYATLAGLAFTPDVYAAGLSYVGPSNILTLLKSIPPYWEPIRKIFDVRVGNPDDSQDLERLKAQSPLFSAEQIRAPLLVVQGANDPRVNKAESEQIVVALRELGRSVEYMLAPDEGHGFAGRENRLSLAAAMERFFARHLGGRYQQALPPDIAARLDELTVDVGTVTLAAQPLGAAEAATAPLPVPSVTQLVPATLSYRTNIEAMGQEIALQVRRTLEAVVADGRRLWRVVDSAQMLMGIVIDTVELDYRTLKPVRRSVQSGGATIMVNHTDEAVTGEIRAGGQVMPINTTLEAPVFGDGAALDAVIAGLPLSPGYGTALRVFDVQMQRVRPMRLSVTGTESTVSDAGTFPTYVVQLTPLDGDEAGTATMNVMYNAPHHVVRSTVRLPAAMGGGNATSELVATGTGTNGR